MAKSKKKSELAEEEAMVMESEAVTEEEISEEETSEEGEAQAETEVEAEAAEQEKPPMTQDDVRLIEAMLFASAHPLDERTMAERFPADRVSLIPDVLAHLQEQYAGRGVNLVQRDRKWALRTSADLGEQLRLEKEQPRKFTRAAMETMAIIAYHQPVTRAEIENIRGVATSPGALDALMEAGWIKPGKRREVPGRPVTWLTTQAFLDHFGLERLGDLPGMEELKASGLLDKRPAIEAMPGTTSDLFGDQEGEDPNEVTDEDLIGRQDDETVASAEDDDADETEDAHEAEDAEDDFDDSDDDDGDDDDDFDDEDDGYDEEDDK